MHQLNLSPPVANMKKDITLEQVELLLQHTDRKYILKPTLKLRRNNEDFASRRKRLLLY